MSVCRLLTGKTEAEARQTCLECHLPDCIPNKAPRRAPTRRRPARSRQPILTVGEKAEVRRLKEEQAINSYTAYLQQRHRDDI